jgi:hypothetical protein
MKVLEDLKVWNLKPLAVVTMPPDAPLIGGNDVEIGSIG